MSLRRHSHAVDVAPALEASLEERLADPVGRLAELQDEQRRIADELEDTFIAYDRKLQGAAKRIASLGADSLTPKEWERLRAEQLELWRLLRRAQAAQRSTRALAREVEEWRAVDSGVLPEGHPDHPETRAEIVESELRVRGVFATVSRAAQEEAEESPVILEEEGRLGEEGTEAHLVSDRGPAPEWTHVLTDDLLLQEIHQHERELARTTAPSDIADLLRSLRDLHASLRFYDRKQARPRLRVGLGLPPHL